MTRWRGALATIAFLVTVIAAVGARPVPSPVATAASQPSALPSAPSVPAATNGPFYTYHSAGTGFDIRLPRGWTAEDRFTLMNRWTVLHLVIGNRGTSLPTPTGNATPLPGQSPDWAQLATDRIVIELTSFNGPGGPWPDSAAAESSFPLDWSDARPVRDGQDSPPTLPFQHLLRPLALVARIGASAPPSDVAEIAGIVASIRPETLPTSGEYRGWRVVGPFASRPVGAVEHISPRLPQTNGFFLVRGAKTAFAFIDKAYLFMGAMKPCPIRYEQPSRTFICDATGERWSRVGKQLSGSGVFNLAFHPAFVKDGLVLVGSSNNGGGRNSYDEAVEFADPVAPTVPAGQISKADILDRYSHVTSTSPTTRAAAKLVPADVARNREVIRGSLIPPATRTVWIVAFAGDVRLPGSAETLGQWTIFIADPQTGAAISAMCCAGGDWPPGFDQLPDLAGN